MNFVLREHDGYDRLTITIADSNVLLGFYPAAQQRDIFKDVPLPVGKQVAVSASRLAHALTTAILATRRRDFTLEAKVDDELLIGLDPIIQFKKGRLIVREHLLRVDVLSAPIPEPHARYGFYGGNITLDTADKIVMLIAPHEEGQHRVH